MGVLQKRIDWRVAMTAFALTLVTRMPREVQ